MTMYPLGSSLLDPALKKTPSQEGINTKIVMTVMSHDFKVAGCMINFDDVPHAFALLV